MPSLGRIEPERPACGWIDLLTFGLVLDPICPAAPLHPLPHYTSLPIYPFTGGPLHPTLLVWHLRLRCRDIAPPQQAPRPPRTAHCNPQPPQPVATAAARCQRTRLHRAQRHPPRPNSMFLPLRFVTRKSSPWSGSRLGVSCGPDGTSSQMIGMPGGSQHDVRCTLHCVLPRARSRCTHRPWLLMLSERWEEEKSRASCAKWWC